MNFVLPFVRFVAPALVIAVGVGIFLYFGHPPATEATMASDDLPVVRVATVDTFDGPFVMEVDGEAVPYRLVTISAEVAGRIVQKSSTARGGKRVADGERLLQIDPTTYQLVVDRLSAKLRQAEAELAAVDVDAENTTKLIELARDDLELQKRQLARVVDLANRGATSDRDLDAARQLELAERNALLVLENDLRTMDQKRETLTATRDLAAVELREAETDLQRTDIAAPLTGTVVATHVEEGDYVRPGDPIITLSDTSRQEVACDLRLEELMWVWLHALAHLPPDLDRLELPPIPVDVVFRIDGHEWIWDGRLERSEGNGLDAETRMLPCRVLVDRPDQARYGADATGEQLIAPPALISGMYLTIRIPIAPEMALLELPADALRAGERVWVCDDGAIRIVDVKVARRRRDTVILRRDQTELQSGDRVVISPLAAVHEGMSVQEETP